MATEVATMASLYKRVGKYWMLQFATPDKSVKRIHLGEIPDRTAQRLRDKVEMLVQAAYFGMPPGRVVESVGSIHCGHAACNQVAGGGIAQAESPQEAGGLPG